MLKGSSNPRSPAALCAGGRPLTGWVGAVGSPASRGRMRQMEVILGSTSGPQLQPLPHPAMTRIQHMLKAGQVLPGSLVRPCPAPAHCPRPTAAKSMAHSELEGGHDNRQQTQSCGWVPSPSYRRAELPEPSAVPCPLPSPTLTPRGPLQS